MSDDRLELPLFDPPPAATEEPLDEPPTRPVPEASFPSAAAAPSTDAPMVVEHLEVPAHEAPTSFSVPQPAGVGSRLAAGFIDLLVHAALAGVLIGGTSLLGVTVNWSHTTPIATVIGLFSLLYHVVPLAFWGRTPGMAVVGLRARTLDDEPLSLPQASKHWLALLLTVATCGLGVLLALGGRSLADRLSGSQTLAQ